MSTPATASKITIVDVDRVVIEPTVALALGGREIPGKTGWVVTLETRDGTRLIVDRLDTDPDGQWLVNGHWLPGRSFPKFWNGRLSRCTFPILADPDVAVAASVARELWVAVDERTAPVAH